MAQQKYDNGACVFAISYKKHYLIKVKVVAYQPETKLYNVTFKDSAGEKDLFANIPEDKMIAESELIQSVLAFNVQGRPDGWNERQTGTYIFYTIDGFLIGSINFDGKWKDYKTGVFYDEVSHYLKIEDFTDDNVIDETEDIMSYEMTIFSDLPKEETSE